MSASKPTATPASDPVVVNFRDEINWFGTVRGRLGVTVRDHALVYATGGLAYADVSHTFSVPSVPFSQNDDDFKTGWVLGGGIELVHDVRWLLRAEALYVDLRDKRHDYTFPHTGCGGPHARPRKLGGQILGRAPRPELQVRCAGADCAAEVANRLASTSRRGVFGAPFVACRPRVGGRAHPVPVGLVERSNERAGERAFPGW